MITGNLVLIATLSLSALSQPKLGEAVPVPDQWIHNGRLIVADYNFAIDSPTAESRWSYMETSDSDGEKGIVFVAEYSPGSRYVVMLEKGSRGIDVKHPEEFAQGMRKTLPKDWKLENVDIEMSDVPTSDARKFKAMMDRPGDGTFYSYGYIVPGRRNFMLLTYSKEAQEPPRFTGFVASFSLLSPGANVLAPAAPHSGVIGIMVIIAIAGAVFDRQYKRRGGRKPSKQDYIYILAAVALCIALLIALGARGCTAEELGGWMGTLLMLLFSMWELGRWLIRRRYPAPPSMVLNNSDAA